MSCEDELRGLVFVLGNHSLILVVGHYFHQLSSERLQEREMSVSVPNPTARSCCGASIALFVLCVFAVSCSLLFPRMLTRFCYNSPDPARVNVSHLKDKHALWLILNLELFLSPCRVSAFTATITLLITRYDLNVILILISPARHDSQLNKFFLFLDLGMHRFCKYQSIIFSQSQLMWSWQHVVTQRFARLFL